MPDYCCLYATFPSQEEAEKHAAALVEQRLIACANLLPAITSIYVWQGKAEKEQEFVLLGKTRNTHQGAIKQYFAAHHSYECPCVLFYPIESGNEDYLHWISESTTLPEKSA